MVVSYSQDARRASKRPVPRVERTGPAASRGLGIGIYTVRNARTAEGRFAEDILDSPRSAC
jgi:hypothetical protein